MLNTGLFNYLLWLTRNSCFAVISQFHLTKFSVWPCVTPWSGTIIPATSSPKRLHILRVLKRAGVPPADLVTIYSALVRSVLEYSSVVWATCLPHFLIDQLEAIQKRALQIVYPDLHYQQALAQANITSLDDRRAHLCLKVWHNMKNNPA